MYIVNGYPKVSVIIKLGHCIIRPFYFQSSFARWYIKLLLFDITGEDCFYVVDDRVLNKLGAGYRQIEILFQTSCRVSVMSFFWPWTKINIFSDFCKISFISWKLSNLKFVQLRNQEPPDVYCLHKFLIIIRHSVSSFQLDGFCDFGRRDTIA